MGGNMGVDLRILTQYINNDQCDFSHDIIGFQRDYKLFDIFEEAEKKHGVVSMPFISFVGDISDENYDYTYGKTKKTPYGDDIKFILVKDIKVALMHIDGDVHWRNKACISYILELPDDLKLWLYWH